MRWRFSRFRWRAGCVLMGHSTGGFTDCLLQHGASRVYWIDVGYGQTAWSLRTDSRVVLKERTNLRRLTPEELYGPDDPGPICGADGVYFLASCLRCRRCSRPDRGSSALVKPQFEVGKERVGKGGGCGTRCPLRCHPRRASTIAWWTAHGFRITDHRPAGNHEYLLWRQGALVPGLQVLMLGKRLLHWRRKRLPGWWTPPWRHAGRRLCSRAVVSRSPVRMRTSLHGGDENLAVADFACSQLQRSRSPRCRRCCRRSPLRSLVSADQR